MTSLRFSFSRTIKKIVKKIWGLKCESDSSSPASVASTLIREADGMSLYRTKDGHLYWLKPDRYLDQDVINKGMFEEQIVELAERFVSPGDVVLDVGANFGLFSVVFSKMVGENGKVIAFEPTKHYLERLRLNVAANELKNCEVVNLGLSDKKQELPISIGICSATIHWFSDDTPSGAEVIKLVRLDDYAEEHGLDRLDFIKLDIDGHEPAFFEGAWKTLDRLEPVIVAEMSEGNFFEAGHHVWELYEELKKRGYHLYNEHTLEEYTTLQGFLRKCGNFAYSGNVVISKRPIV